MRPIFRSAHSRLRNQPFSVVCRLRFYAFICTTVINFTEIIVIITYLSTLKILYLNENWSLYPLVKHLNLQRVLNLRKWQFQFLALPKCTLKLIYPKNSLIST